MKTLFTPITLFILSLVAFGNFFFVRNDYENAINLYQIADIVDVFDYVFEVDYNLGSSYFYQKEYQKSLDKLTHSIKLANNDDEIYKVYFNLGVVYYNFAEAQKDKIDKKEYLDIICKQALGSFEKAAKFTNNPKKLDANIEFIKKFCEEEQEEDGDEQDKQPEKENEADITEDDINKIEERERKNKEHKNQADGERQDYPNSVNKPDHYW
jgi:tetratricopeptide (TPR) repeat protein